MTTENQETTDQRGDSSVESTDLLAELVFYGAHNYGNHAYCGRCGKMCGRDACRSCDETREVDGEPCEDCLEGERFWCDDCGEIEGWLPEGQYAPSANVKLRDGGTETDTTK